MEKAYKDPARTLSLAVIISCLVIAAAAQTGQKDVLPRAGVERQLTAGPRIPLLAIVHDGHSLAGDAQGPYRDATNGCSVFGRQSLNLFVWAHVEPRSNVPDSMPIARHARYLKLDLNRPLEGSGAVKILAGEDYLARLHVFWKYEESPSGKNLDKLYLMTEIPIGSTVESERVEMWVRISAVQHVLQMGPWAMGRYSARAAVNGRGTTKALITRQGEASWRIKAPDGSIARLWDYSNIERPRDKGLFYFDFDVEFAGLEKGL